MNAEYRKDLHHKYMVLQQSKDSETQPYCIKMLSKNNMEGLLMLELRCIDNHNFIYYDITAKQSLNQLFVKNNMNAYDARNLLLGIMNAIELTYEYLLNEDDIILSSEFIYVDLVTNKISLCYYPGYQQDIKNQMSQLLEYLMNRIDYNDKEVVMLVYNLYAISKEEGYAFYELKNQLKSDLTTYIEETSYLQEASAKNTKVDKNSLVSMHQEGPNNIKVLDNDTSTKKDKRPPINRLMNKNNMPPCTDNEHGLGVMKEMVTGEKEISYYPIKTYLLSAAGALFGIILIFIGFTSKIIYHSMGSHIDVSKLCALLLIICCIESYFMKIIWDKKNKITKLVPMEEYINPLEDTAPEEEALEKPITTDKRLHIKDEEEVYHQDFYSAEQRKQKNKKAQYNQNQFEEDDNPTCLLSEINQRIQYFLKPVEETTYDAIHITEFPFFIGKLKQNVDYCLEKEVVSRYHAKLTMEGDRFYLTDLNSTNGTFINKESVPTYQPIEVKEGDEIAFANIKYRFEIQ
ncbi:FHA domain-containing protein [Mobilitalea sibirica]|uniref:FHA domain-containing protein n=1 Tax=Mobilitalea sibirica TaxID=1462919 RepID=A0A8J7HBF2_9FIRM|nr:DUF6382 domain-containing protein [Mobilitalea sibirica]MBH1941021.1 FHA domain-containing protein [Mobilitalea sibirica]